MLLNGAPQAVGVMVRARGGTNKDENHIISFWWTEADAFKARNEPEKSEMSRLSTVGLVKTMGINIVTSENRIYVRPRRGYGAIFGPSPFEKTPVAYSRKIFSTLNMWHIRHACSSSGVEGEAHVGSIPSHMSFFSPTPCPAAEPSLHMLSWLRYSISPSSLYLNIGSNTIETSPAKIHSCPSNNEKKSLQEKSRDK